MRRYMRPIKVHKEFIFDVVGTGGDGQRTFNISTVTAFVVAGAGVTVCKHGNRAVSGTCGSADLLEELGVNINASIESVERCIAEAGIGFLFAPLLHPAMKYVQPARKKLGIRTMFNVLGPLINPARPTHQLLGVYEEGLVPVIGEALRTLGMRHAMVVWGEGGFDEVTITGLTRVCEVKEGHLKDYHLNPDLLGIKRVDARDIAGGDAPANKHIALNVLKGMEGPERDIILLNTACCLYIAGLCHTIKEGVHLAQESLDSGAAIKKLNKLIEYSNEETTPVKDLTD
jgi:anthranilate phosphoribosyltransferase